MNMKLESKNGYPVATVTLTKPCPFFSVGTKLRLYEVRNGKAYITPGIALPLEDVEIVEIHRENLTQDSSK